MDFRHPLHAVAPTLDGDVLSVLAGADKEFTGREVHRMLGHSSEQGVRKALSRLVDQGVVHARAAGPSRLYAFNADHLAAPWISGLVDMRGQLVTRCREAVAAWEIPPVAAAIFGSAARGEATPTSDLDLFFVRPSGADDARWEAQVAALAEAATRWTGNDARPLVFDADDITTDEPVLQEILSEGIEIGGSLRALRRSLR